MTDQSSRRLTGIAMAGAAGLAIAGFTALGSIFDYPKILKEPTTDILNSFQESETAVRLWFLALVVGAAMLAPVAVLLRRFVSGPLGPWIVGTGIAAATVQVVGLSRWVLVVPGISDDAADPALTDQAARTFERLHFWLGTVIGETIGYALTAAFTVLVVVGVNRISVPDWVRYLGYGAAALIATGVTIPLGLEGASITNFIGYIAWCLWLIVMAVVLWRAPEDPGGAVRPTTDRQNASMVILRRRSTEQNPYPTQPTPPHGGERLGGGVRLSTMSPRRAPCPQA